MRTDGATQAFILDAGHTPHRYELEIRGCHICAGGDGIKKVSSIGRSERISAMAKDFPPRMENDGQTTEMSGHTLGLFMLVFSTF